MRIVPAYYAVLILCIAGVFPGMASAATQEILARLLFLQDYTGSNINVVFWSLGVEEKFYIIAPVVVLLLLKQKRMASFAAMAAAMLLISPVCRGLTFEAWSDPISYDAFFTAMRSPFHMSLEGFVVGIMVGILRARGLAVPKSSALAGFGATVAVLALWLGSYEFLSAISNMVPKSGPRQGATAFRPGKTPVVS